MRLDRLDRHQGLHNSDRLKMYDRLKHFTGLINLMKIVLTYLINVVDVHFTRRLDSLNGLIIVLMDIKDLICLIDLTDFVPTTYCDVSTTVYNF
jgi:hypothetical protein